MKLTPLETKCLREALIYAICDYEENLNYQIENDFDKSEIKVQRQLLKGMERVHSKLERYKNGDG
jgi:hypothetical protein